MVATKSKFAALAKGVDWVNLPARGHGFEDEPAAEMAVIMIAAHEPQVMFVHFGGVDVVGHAVGWGTPQQIAAIEKADACVGRVLGAIKTQHLEDSTFIILTADHGGTGKWHGPDDPRARHIPWIAVGPGIRKNLDLTTFRELTINTEDTFATTCWLLNIPVTQKIDGKPVMVIAQDAQVQLMHDTPQGQQRAK
jgi:2,3-bisphosphoglycerate-independent phosphoglycerate mutase